MKNNKIFKHLVLCLVLITISVFALSACEKDNINKDDFNLQVSTDIVLREDSSPDSPALSFSIPEKKEFCVFVNVTLDNSQGSVDEEVSLVLYMSNSDDFEATSIGGDAVPKREKVDKDGVSCWKFSGVSWTVSAGKTVNRTLKLSIYAKSAGQNVLQVELDGDISDNIPYQQNCEYTAVEMTELEKPVVKIKGIKMVWDAVENCVGYYVKINNGQTIKLSTSNIDMTNYPAGDYTVEISAKGDASLYKTSSPTIITFKKLAVPTVSVVQGVLNWDAIEGADSYTINVGDSFLASVDVLNFSTLYLDEPNSYNFEVFATSASEFVMQSNSSASVEIIKLSAPVIRISGRNVVWGSVTNAFSYQVYLDGVAHGSPVSKTEFTIPGNTYGMEIYIVAIGAGNTTLTSENSNSVKSMIGG